MSLFVRRYHSITGLKYIYIYIYIYNYVFGDINWSKMFQTLSGMVPNTPHTLPADALNKSMFIKNNKEHETSTCLTTGSFSEHNDI